MEVKKYKILVCCHKGTPRMKDKVFVPILLGSSYADSALKESFQDDFWDNTGENIGALHPYCAELSAIYWAWKNYDLLENPDYIGLFHYRRFLNFSQEIHEGDLWKCAFFDFEQSTKERFGWDEDTISRFCGGYDLILPYEEQILDPKDWKTPASLEIHYKHAHYPEDFEKAKDLIREVHPKYTESLEHTCASQQGHFCNMFVMTREMFFDYADWLFRIILPLKKSLPITDRKYEKFNGTQKRVLGFLGERLFNVWIDYQRDVKKIRIKETQRLIGYLTEQEKGVFQKTYGRAAYVQACKQASSVARISGVLTQRTWPERPDVSIIVPVYNVAPYLRECLDSLLNQTLKNIEIICINNGSTDKSAEIIAEYQARDQRIVLIDLKENVGMPRARNLGMTEVRGKYFAFVDSDDICDLTMYEKLYQKAESLFADITTCSVWVFFDTIENRRIHRPLEWYCNSDQALPLSARPQQLLEPAGWCKLFRTEYIRGLDYFEFRPNVLSWEDVPCITSAFIQTDRIATVQEALYFYRQRSNGNLTASMDRRHIDDFISGVKEQSYILARHCCTDPNILSYVEEFKFLMAEYILSKLGKTDISYFFQSVKSIFDKKDEAALSRIFKLYPKRKFLYKMIMHRTPVLYRVGRLALSVAQRGKRLLKRIFHISRLGVYKTIGLGPFSVKYVHKRYLNQTLGWYENRVYALEVQLSAWSKDAAELRQALAEAQQQISSLQYTVEAGDKHRRELEAEKQAAQVQRDEWKEHLEQSRAKCLTLIHDIEIVKQAMRTQEAVHQRQRDEWKERLEKEQAECLKLTHDAERTQKVIQEQASALQQQEVIFQQQREECLRIADILQKKEQETHGFYYAVWNTGWVDVWKNFYFHRFEEIGQLSVRLKESLDSESQELADRICYRNFELLPLQKDSKLFLYDHLHIYTPEEREGAAIPIDEEYFRQKYVLPADEYLEIPVFKFHCGMLLFPEMARRQVAGADVIDGGAYWGDSALVLSEYAPRTIHAFEPQPQTFAKLEKTVDDNGLTDIVIPVPFGLGDEPEIKTLYTGEMKSGANFMHINPVLTNHAVITNDVAVTSIDNYAQEHNLRVGLIKLDIEGNELEAIRGAEQIIRRDRPLLVVSIYHRPQDFFEIKPLLERMDLGYQFIIRKLSYHDLVSEVMLLGYVDKREEDS